MSAQNPPRLANWLLTRSGFARQNPPLAGDLLEEFRNGRSAAWFWRQTLVVILAGMARNARLVPRLLAGAVIGWAVEGVFISCRGWVLSEGRKDCKDRDMRIRGAWRFAALSPCFCIRPKPGFMGMQF